MGIPKPALWTVLEAGELLWRADTVCEIVQLDADSARVRVLDMVICDYTAPASVHTFSDNDTDSILYTDTPLRIDTAVVDSHGVAHVSRSEVVMLHNVELEIRAAAQDSAHESLQSACSGSGDSDATTTDTGDRGILDYDCIAATQQMLPWGSQYRNIVSRESHPWVLASLDRDPQVAAAALAAENAARQLGAGEEKRSLLAYSDGSVIADGIEGSAAAVIRIGSVDVCATVWLAAAHRALSSGRSE